MVYPFVISFRFNCFRDFLSLGYTFMTTFDRSGFNSIGAEGQFFSGHEKYQLCIFIFMLFFCGMSPQAGKGREMLNGRTK